MVATISHLSSSHAMMMMRCNLHKVSSPSPSAPPLFSRPAFSTTNITFPFDFNHIFPKLRVSPTSSVHKCHAITTPCKNNSTSVLLEDYGASFIDNRHVKNSNVSASTNGSSIFKAFGDNNVVNLQIMLSRFLKSFLLYGVIAVMTMAMALCSHNSAFAASYGRMGGSSSSSSSRSSSSGGSSSRSSSGGSSSYKYSSYSSPSRNSSYRRSSYLSDSEPSRVETPTFICNCHKENKNEPLTQKSCTDCTCSKEGTATPTCICNCHKEDKNEPLTQKSCTDCNCSKEGTATPNCICNCHKEDENETLSSKSSTDCNCSKEGSKVQNPKKSKAPLIILALAALGAIAKFVSWGGGPGSVLMVQVGILDKERVLQKKLNKIADSADTSTVDGLNYVLKGVVKALLEHLDSCQFAYFYDEFGSSMKKSVRPYFEALLNREIDRYDKDENTLVNVDGVKYKKAVVDKSNNVVNQYSVVTLLVLASDFKLDESQNRSIGHLKSLLQTIQTIPKRSIESVEVLWTPQREDESLSLQELDRDFPLMKVV